MTTNKLNRGPEDPMWSGRLVQGSDGGWLYEECTIDHLISHLAKAITVANRLHAQERLEYDVVDGHSWVKKGHAVELAELYELVDNLQRGLPWVLVWCVGIERPAGSDGTPGYFDVITGHVDIENADRWLIEAQWRCPTENVAVQLHPVPILQVIHPDATPDMWDRLVMGR